MASLRIHYPESTGDISRAIEALDSEVRAVLAREAFFRFPETEWWLRNAPLYASRVFCRDFKEAYGIEISVRSQYDDDIHAMRLRHENGRRKSSVCIDARAEGWHVARRPDLLFHACKTVLNVSRGQRRLLWSWANGEVSDEEFAVRFT